MKYKGFIVINSVEMALEMDGIWSEEAAQAAMLQFRDVESVWLGLEDGSMVSVNKQAMANTYFIVKPVKE